MGNELTDAVKHKLKIWSKLFWEAKLCMSFCAVTTYFWSWTYSANLANPTREMVFPFNFLVLIRKTKKKFAKYVEQEFVYILCLLKSFLVKKVFQFLID